MVTLGLSTLLLTACGNLGSSSGTTTNTNEESASSGYQTTGQTNDSEYNGVIINGRYRTNKSRGVGVSQNSENLLNLKSFESGLTDISKEYFSTKDYVFQEGQTLSKSTVEDWLARKSSKNPDGLNPEDNGKNGENERNPMYVQQIEEQDYMKEDSKGNLYFNIFAGFPPTIAYGGTSFTTTAPAATIAPRPIVTPDKIKALVAIQTSSSTIIGPFVYPSSFPIL